MFFNSYFPVDCTQEMLDEWLPLLCPFDLSSLEGACYLSEFLPTLLPLEDLKNGVRCVTLTS